MERVFGRRVWRFKLMRFLILNLIFLLIIPREGHILRGKKIVVMIIKIIILILT